MCYRIQIIKGTRLMEGQINGMHLKVDKMETNVTTKVQHNIFIQKDICRGVFRPRDNPSVTSTSTRKQTLDNEDKSTVAMLVLTNRGTPLQQGSIGSAHKETEMETLDTDGRLGMGSSDMDQRMRDDAHDPTNMSNDACGHKDELLYESKTASKWNDKTRSDTSGDVLAQMGYPHKGIIMKKTGAVMPMPKVTDEVPDKTSPRGELTPALRIQANGISNLDTREAGRQRMEQRAQGTMGC